MSDINLYAIHDEAFLHMAGLRPKVIPPLTEHPLRGKRKRGKHTKKLFYALGYFMSLEKAYKLRGVSRRQVRVMYKSMVNWAWKFH